MYTAPEAWICWNTALTNNSQLFKGAQGREGGGGVRYFW